MHDPFRNYDQWKTAAPEYDEETREFQVYWTCCEKYSTEDLDLDVIAPGESLEMDCPFCEQRFKLDLEFYSIARPTDASM